MLPIPDARIMAKEVIKKHPNLLKDSTETECIIMRLMVDYRDKCKAYTSQDEPLINAIKKQLSILNNLT